MCIYNKGATRNQPAINPQLQHAIEGSRFCNSQSTRSNPQTQPAIEGSRILRRRCGLEASFLDFPPPRRLGAVAKVSETFHHFLELSPSFWWSGLTGIPKKSLSQKNCSDPISADPICPFRLSPGFRRGHEKSASPFPAHPSLQSVYMYVYHNLYRMRWLDLASPVWASIANRPYKTCKLTLQNKKQKSASRLSRASEPPPSCFVSVMRWLLCLFIVYKFVAYLSSWFIVMWLVCYKFVLLFIL